MSAEAPTIVVVDDAAEVRTLVRTRLRLSGRFTVVGEGVDGREAIELVALHRPDLVLMDVSMPGMDGLEALPLVRRRSPETRVVLYTGFEEEGLAQEALRRGASAFVEKSAPVSALLDRLEAVLGGSLEPAPATPAHDTSSTGHRGGDDPLLAEHAERFREVFEEAAIGMATLTLSGRVVRANRALGALVRRQAASLVGELYRDLAQADGDHVESALQDLENDRLDLVQVEHCIDDGGTQEPRRLLATFAPVRDSAARPLYLFLQVQDVTAQRLAEEALRTSEERFRLLVATVKDYAIFMLSPEGIVTSWNVGAQRSKGYTAEEIIGRHFRTFYPPDVAASGHPEHELAVARAEGRYEEEGWRVRKDGTYFWANVVITAVHDDEGRLIGFAKVTRDTTERRRMMAEREAAAAALSEANRELEALNAQLREAVEEQTQFLAVTAHELRTPVGVLGGSADTLVAHLQDLTAEELAELLAGMTASATRLRRLLADLLTASRLQASALDLAPRALPLAGVLAAAVTTARSVRPDAEVVLDVPADLRVYADPDRVGQVFDNLLSNALRHGVAPIAVCSEVRGGTVEIRVADQGAGVPADVVPRLFQRFASGERRSGTGLGLFIARELARAQGGDVTYEPPSAGSPGGFLVTLPSADRGSC